MDKKMNIVLEGKRMLCCIARAYELYMTNGARSSKKVDCFHNHIKCELEKIFKNSKYSVKLEQNVPSTNASNKKKCDIVVYEMNTPMIVFPVKMIMTNYKQNRNNSWENLTGELTHLKCAHWRKIQKNPRHHIVQQSNKICEFWRYIGWHTRSQ